MLRQVAAGDRLGRAAGHRQRAADRTHVEHGQRHHRQHHQRHDRGEQHQRLPGHLALLGQRAVELLALARLQGGELLFCRVVFGHRAGAHAAGGGGRFIAAALQLVDHAGELLAIGAQLLQQGGHQRGIFCAAALDEGPADLLGTVLRLDPFGALGLHRFGALVLDDHFLLGDPHHRHCAAQLGHLLGGVGRGPHGRLAHLLDAQHPDGPGPAQQAQQDQHDADGAIHAKPDGVPAQRKKTHDRHSLETAGPPARPLVQSTAISSKTLFRRGDM